MGVILKYQINFPEVGLKVSNDLTSGDFIIDADITAAMPAGMMGSQFEIKLYDLPQKKVDQLNDKLKDTKLGTAVIKLGYMDGGVDVAMAGLYKKIVTTVEGDKLITMISGLEVGTHALRFTRFQNNLGGTKSIYEAVTSLLQSAKFVEGEVDRAPKFTPKDLSGDLQDSTLRGENLIEILDQLARRADAEFLVYDKAVRIGRPITNNDYEPKQFDRDVNLAVFRPFIKQLPAVEGDNRQKKLPSHQIEGFRFIIAGDPKLRPAQKVLANVKGYDKKANVEFRIHSLEHRFSTNSGYVCEGVAVKACSNENCRRQQNAAGQSTPETVVQSLSQKIKDEPRLRPSLEIGSVKEYMPGDSGEAKHRGTLYFGQRFEGAETQPSIRAEVEADDTQLLRNKPLVSPFAWHKCGLVVPVYPGMKALLSHNLNLPDDALVTGFLWSEKPTLEPPKNKTGDWWLCLPIDFDSSNPPTDSTKAVNDLIANNGKRVIEVKSLKITVGADKLPNVGARPSAGEDDEFLIEHKSGTRLKIAADGSLSIEASSISIKGDVTIEGNVEIK
ncbi:MAG TPA: hypothetical protein VKD91_03225 [Pyrinomonadaceae bacterium]|nr:hypothetical protein [Pyrinomonadaceae bacterium]